MTARKSAKHLKVRQHGRHFVLRQVSAGLCPLYFSLFLCFLPFNIDQKIDGRALLRLAKEGTIEQLNACGLKTVGEQMKLRDFVLPLEEPFKLTRKKPTIAQIKSMTDLNQRLYKAK